MNLEDVDYVVCMRLEDMRLKDLRNRRGACADCSAEIVYRKNVPAKPPKICLSCALDRLGVEESNA